MNCGWCEWKGSDMRVCETSLSAVALACLVVCGSGCSTLDRAYRQEVTWTNAPVVQVVTNTVVVTKVLPVVTERTNVVFVTNEVGVVHGYAQFVKWLMEHQKEAGVFTTVSELVQQLTD